MVRLTFRLFSTTLLFVGFMFPSLSCWAQTSMDIKKVDGRIEVSIGDQLFTAYNYQDTAKPFLYPVYGPGQTRMTRDFPMKQTAGEGDDHPHHKSIWIGHQVSGADFWHGHDGEKIVVDGEPVIDEQLGTVTANSNWVDGSGKTICSDRTKWTFGFDDDSRWIDCRLELRASSGNITIDDTKEGMVAIRTHPDLRLNPDPKRGVKEVFGSAVNSQGSAGEEIWGQAAAWVLYSGEIESKPTSMLIMDHPESFRYPTTWHARDYGLVAANPFGLQQFQKMEPGAGAVALVKQQSLTFQYRFQFFDKRIDAEVAGQAMKRWVQSGRENSSSQ